MKKYIAIIGLLLITVLPSCVTYDKCVAKFGSTGDTTYIPYTVVIPKDSIITQIQIDSIPYMVHGDTHFVESPETRAKIKYWYNKYLQAISIQAECDSIIIHDTIPCPPTPILEKEQSCWPCWNKLLAKGFIAMFLLGLFYAFIYPLILKK